MGMTTPDSDKFEMLSKVSIRIAFCCYGGNFHLLFTHVGITMIFLQSNIMIMANPSDVKTTFILLGLYEISAIEIVIRKFRRGHLYIKLRTNIISLIKAVQSRI